MIRGTWIRNAALALTLTSALAAITAAAAQGTAFTYQGSLDNGGTPASGLYDFRFVLFNDPTSGVAIGPVVCLDDVPVVAGVFTVQLDFGAVFATTDERHLEIMVRNDTTLTCGSGAGFVLLSPRQKLTAAPIASHAASAFTLAASDGVPANAVYVDSTGWVGIGTTSPQAPLHVNGGFRMGGQATNHMWSGHDGSGLYLEQRGSTVATSRLRIQSSRNGDLANYSQLNLDPANGISFMGLGTGNGNVGVGTSTPAAKLDVRGDIKLGPSGQYQASGGTEKIRVLRGTVSSAGSILAGTGFTASRVITGVYLVTFSSAFSGTPSVTVTPRLGSGSVYYVANTHLVSTTSFNVYVVNLSGAVANAEFDFTVMGPRL